MKVFHFRDFYFVRKLSSGNPVSSGFPPEEKWVFFHTYGSAPLYMYNIILMQQHYRRHRVNLCLCFKTSHHAKHCIRLALHENEPAGRTHFHMNGLERRLLCQPLFPDFAQFWFLSLWIYSLSVCFFQVFFSNLESSTTVDKRLVDKALRFRQHLTKRFNWDFESEPEEFAPVVVET